MPVILGPSTSEPPIIASYGIGDILSIMDDELHGKKNAFSEAQKIRHLNKAVDEFWKISKLVHQDYWLTNNTPGLNLDSTNTDFILPPDLAEIRLIEVTAPVDYTGLDIIRHDISSPLFKTERQAFRALQGVGTPDSALAIPGQLNYVVYGPDSAGQQHILFSRPAPVPLTLLVWYVRFLGHFSIPKNTSEVLFALLSPYIWNIAVYAVKSLLKSEDTDMGEYQKWQEEWSKEIDRAMPAAHERSTADDDTVPGFVEL